LTSLRLFTEKVFPRSRRARLIIQKTQRSEIRKTTYENIECCSICDESRFILRNSVFSLDKSTWNSWNFLTSLRFFVNLMPENSARHVKNQTLVRTGIQQKNHARLAAARPNYRSLLQNIVPFCRALLQKRPIILRSLLIVATL